MKISIKKILIVTAVTIAIGMIVTRGEEFETHYRVKYPGDTSWRRKTKMVCATGFADANEQLDIWLFQQERIFPGAQFRNSYYAPKTGKGCSTLP